MYLKNWPGGAYYNITTNITTHFNRKSNKLNIRSKKWTVLSTSYLKRICLPDGTISRPISGTSATIYAPATKQPLGPTDLTPLFSYGTYKTGNVPGTIRRYSGRSTKGILTVQAHPPL